MSHETIRHLVEPRVFEVNPDRLYQLNHAVLVSLQFVSRLEFLISRPSHKPLAVTRGCATHL